MKTFQSLLLVLVVAAPLSAASEYTFAISGEGAYSVNDRGRIVVDGLRWRMDLERTSDEPRTYDSVILLDDGQKVALNHSNKTWYRLKPGPPILLKSNLFGLLFSTRASNIRIQLEPQPKLGNPSSVAGVHRLLSFSYDISTEVSAERLKGKVWGTIALWTREASDRFARVPLFLDLSTGLDNVDERLKQALTNVRGAAWISELTVNRKIVGGKAMTHVIRTTLSDGHTVVVRSFQFAVPDGYQYQEPVLGVPGTS